VKVALFVPCFVDLLAPRIAAATTRLLTRIGHDVVVPRDQTCCGQPALNMGYLEDAAHLARRLLRVLDASGADAIVCPSGSCVAALRVEGPAVLGVQHPALDRLYELSEFLSGAAGTIDMETSFPARVTWHDGCHALRVLGIREGPRRLLARVSGLELVEMEHVEECCGFGGTFAVKVPDVSAAMGRRKIDAITATGARYVASTEPSCLAQIGGLLARARSRVRTIHLAEILAGNGASS
jgi:L-lactate dehydrogenase complex protein LldE